MDGWIGGCIIYLDGFGNNMSRRRTVINITQNLEILTTYINIIGRLNQADSSLTTRSREEKLNINICLCIKAYI